MSIDAFDEILLEDTYVLGWSQTPNLLTFTVLASLLQSHPQAAPPLAGEWACYKPGVIRFSGVSSIAGLLPQEVVTPISDPDGSIDFGCIDDLSQIRPGEFRIAGEFGMVAVAATAVALVLGGAA